MNGDLSKAIEQLVQEAPRPWLETVCAALQSWPAGALAENMLQRLPSTHNGDLAYQLRELVRLSEGAISWEALSSSIALCASLYARWQTEQKVELLWAGPAPADGVPARRIDQVLYDLIATAQKDILLVTFAAHKIHRLAEGGGPETLDCPAPRAHPVYLRYLELRYRSEFQPSVHRYHCPSGNTGARGGWLSCTRNRAQFVELRREPESATVQAGFLGTRRGSASAFLVFSRVYGTPESPAAIAGLLSWIPKIGELLLSAGEKSLPHELQMPAAKSATYVR